MARARMQVLTMTPRHSPEGPGKLDRIRMARAAPWLQLMLNEALAAPPTRARLALPRLQVLRTALPRSPSRLPVRCMQVLMTALLRSPSHLPLSHTWR